MTLERTLSNLRRTKEGYFNTKIYFRHSNSVGGFYNISTLISVSGISYIFNKYECNKYIKKNMLIFGYDSKKPYKVFLIDNHYRVKKLKPF